MAPLAHVTSEELYVFLFGWFCFCVLVSLLVVFCSSSDETEYWRQVHENNQEKIKRDRMKEFEANFHVPVQYHSTRKKGETDAESETA